MSQKKPFITLAQARAIAAMIATNFCDWNMEKVEGMLADCKEAFVREYEA